MLSTKRERLLHVMVGAWPWALLMAGSVGIALAATFRRARRIVSGAADLLGTAAPSEAKAVMVDL